MLIMLALPVRLVLQTAAAESIVPFPTIFNELRAAVWKLEELVLQIRLCLTPLLFASPLCPITARRRSVAAFAWPLDQHLLPSQWRP
jgi:hypothetical protein